MILGIRNTPECKESMNKHFFQAVFKSLLEILVFSINFETLLVSNLLFQE